MLYWFIFTVPPLLLGLYAQAKVKRTFAKYSQVRRLEVSTALTRRPQCSAPPACRS